MLVLFGWMLIFLSPIFIYLLKQLIKKKVKEYKYNRKVALNKKMRKEQEERHLETLENYDKVVKPMYVEGRDLFKRLMQEKKIKKYNVKEFKLILDGYLGENLGYYDSKKFNFKNDAHEIYVKMKNFKLTSTDWSNLLDYLQRMEYDASKRNEIN